MRPVGVTQSQLSCLRSALDAGRAESAAGKHLRNSQEKLVTCFSFLFFLHLLEYNFWGYLISQKFLKQRVKKNKQTKTKWWRSGEFVLNRFFFFFYWFNSTVLFFIAVLSFSHSLVPITQWTAATSCLLGEALRLQGSWTAAEAKAGYRLNAHYQKNKKTKKSYEQLEGRKQDCVSLEMFCTSFLFNRQI